MLTYVLEQLVPPAAGMGFVRVGRSLVFNVVAITAFDNDYIYYRADYYPNGGLAQQLPAALGSKPTK